LRLRVLKGNQFLGKQLWDKATMNFGRAFVMRSGSKLWGAFATFKMNLLPRNRKSIDNLMDLIFENLTFLRSEYILLVYILR
jgi:hypothetical protein